MTFDDTKKSLRKRAEAMLQILPEKLDDLTQKEVHHPHRRAQRSSN